ncbi:hypothetical protein ABFX02_12G058000 [Erythranthe guttata]
MAINGCRISQQLREYNPRQFGICSLTNNTKCCFYYNRVRPPQPPPPRIFPFLFNYTTTPQRFSKFQLLGTNSSSSSSFVTNNNNEDLVSSINKEACTQDIFSDSLSRAENDENSLSEGLAVAGGIVALGKFDALHIGHRELAIQAAKIGVPFLLSFVGMAEILGWEPRAPIVAKCDRKRVLSSWAPLCGNIIPKEFQIDFSKVRSLSPQQFVEKLAEELGVGGVVAGQNYRFGYRAAGDASDLVRLCNEYGMKASIINSVMDNNQESVKETFSSNSHEKGQVSSTRVRHALAKGDMKYVTELLGRHHRLIVRVKNSEKVFRERKRLSVPRSCLLNLAPKEGLYENCSLVIGDADQNVVVPCRLVIDTTDIHLELLDELAPPINTNTQYFESLGIEFSDSKV